MSEPDPAPSARPRILVVDDDAPMALGLKALLEKEGYRADAAGSAAEALQRLASAAYQLILSDVRMPELSGFELLAEVQRTDPNLPVVLLTGHATVANAVEAMKQGAFDYIAKPFTLDQVRLAVRRALERGQLVEEVSYLRQGAVSRLSFGNVVAGPAMQAVLERARKVADARSSVLIAGETGTGKELVAKAIHHASPRSHRPFLAVNCAALAEGLIESELFGHARGAFTGAVEPRSGFFEVAHGGTLLLDEIGELPGALQAKLLRVLQDGSFQRVGETRTRTTDVRVLAATHRDLEESMRAGRFREDLYYRLAVVQIRIPSLRERREDIPALARQFLGEFASELKKPVRRIPDSILVRLAAYDWPGNVRELRNAIERGVLLADGPELSADALPGGAVAAATGTAASSGAIVTLAEHERAYLAQVLAAAKNNKNLAAKLLGITRRSLYRKLDKHKLKSP